MDYIKVYKAANSNEAHFIKGLLEQNSFDVKLLGENLSVAMGGLPLEVIQVDILVHKTNYDEAKAILEKLDLFDRLNHKPNELSGGEQQRVAIARSLINSPDIVFADEPTGNLDSENSQNLIKMIKKLNKEYNQTFVIVTHNKDFLKISDYSYTIKDGRIKLN